VPLPAPPRDFAACPSRPQVKTAVAVLALAGAASAFVPTAFNGAALTTRAATKAAVSMEFAGGERESSSSSGGERSCVVRVS
jgi:hypothetical protein